jgi:hypothetical protein
MPETLSTPEIAHAASHQRGRAAGGHREVVEVAEGLLLALVAVATAWSGYQAARWNGRQAHLYGLASRNGVLATSASSRSGQEQLYDSNTFSYWLQATARGDSKVATLFERRFRPEFRPAFHAWVAADPFHNPNAPPGPLVMPQYHNASAERSAALGELAARDFEGGTSARETGDEYLRNTVLLATVLFLTALAQRFKTELVRLSLLGLSAALLGIAVYYVVTYPRI